MAVADQIISMKVYCLGDVVGYGASPNQVVEWVRDNVEICLLGNHDHATATGDTSWFNSAAGRAVDWTRSALSGSNMKYLQSLEADHKLELEGIKALLAHGSPEDALFEYVHPSTHEQLFDYYLEKNRTNLIALGHTHVPFMRKSTKGIVFNPGSVGQPRSGNPDASYAILTVRGKKIEVEHKLVKYNIDGAAAKIRAAGLPRILAERLYQGL